MVDSSMLEQFLDGSFRNLWLEWGPFEVYMRKRWGNEQVDIANIESKQKGSGFVRSFVTEVEQQATKRGYKRVFLENVHNTRLIPVCIELGYKQDTREGVWCGFKMLDVK